MIGPLTASKKLELGLRYFIASVLLLTGIGKLLDVPGFIQVIDTYKIIPTFLQPAVAISMVLVELKIAENLFRKINLKINLKYYEGSPVIKEIKRISKPGRRVYFRATSIPRVMNGLGLAILSTPKGVMTDIDARKNNIGGEIICRIF